jgi:hypothetical protein
MTRPHFIMSDSALEGLAGMEKGVVDFKGKHLLHGNEVKAKMYWWMQKEP